jgi:hypothetical protein
LFSLVPGGVPITRPEYESLAEARRIGEEVTTNDVDDDVDRSMYNTSSFEFGYD